MREAQQLRASAQREADETRETARREADEMLESAETRAQELSRSAEVIWRERRRLLDDMRGVGEQLVAINEVEGKRFERLGEGALLALAQAAPAAASIVVAGPDRPLVLRWVQHLSLPLPSREIVVSLSGCPAAPQAAGCSAPGMIWLRRATSDRAVLLHELGHQFDYGQPQWSRAAFEALNNDHRPWETMPNGPAEQFAEAWMACAAPSLAASSYDDATGRYDLAYGYQPTRRQLQRACRLIRRTASAAAT